MSQSCFATMNGSTYKFRITISVISNDKTSVSHFTLRIFCLEYPSTRSEKGNVHFANYRFSFRKLQILISQTTDFHFANYRFPFRKLQILISQTTDSHFANYRFPFRFVPFRFANYSKPKLYNTWFFLESRHGTTGYSTLQHLSRSVYTFYIYCKESLNCEEPTVCTVTFN